MGDKLVKMVKIIYSFIFIISFNNILAEESSSASKLKALDYKFNPLENAKIYSITGNTNNMFLNEIRIDKPNPKTLQKYGLLSRRDRYALKVENDQGKQILLVGLGDPFTIHIDHIGYEDKKIFQADIPRDFEIALPVSAKAEYFVLLYQDKFGLNEVKRIKVD